MDRDIDIVDRLRMGGPNAMEVVDLAANEIERLRHIIENTASTCEAIAGTANHTRDFLLAHVRKA